MQIEVKRSGVEFMPDPSRIIARFLFTGEKRASKTIASVLSMSNKDASITLGQILRDYSLRHRNISKIFERHFNRVSYLLKPLNVDPASLDIALKILIGAYFTCEYSIESAAFFNPSIIEHPDQSELEPGAKRIIISFRATGEGHISSIVFRAGVLDKNSNLQIEPTGRMLEEAEHVRRHVYEKSSFRNKLNEMHIFLTSLSVDAVLDKLNDSFTYGELRRCVDAYKNTIELNTDAGVQLNQIIWLASSHYELDFSLDTNLSERVIFPVSAHERNGIEDARFVKFTNDDGKTKYYATYTAYDGISILPKMLETSDFYHFKISPMHGEIAQNKGMALFPRKVKGKYAMLCRLDGVNNYIAYSDQFTVWREAKLLQEPKYPWEFVQIGNCGSPIETADGWLVITHGVGAMREYVLGASLFDLNDPELEIGRLSSPLLIPNADEREGYVPNVVYSCGSMIHNDDLIIPYAMSDYASTYASINLQELLDELKTSE
jgi:predicted GH43/DUF377 family glycosyl hydrolase